MKRSEVCWIYGRELVVFNGKNERNRQNRVWKKDKNVGIRKAVKEKRKGLSESWDVRLEKDVRYGIR